MKDFPLGALRLLLDVYFISQSAADVRGKLRKEDDATLDGPRYFLKFGF